VNIIGGCAVEEPDGNCEVWNDESGGCAVDELDGNCAISNAEEACFGQLFIGSLALVRKPASSCGDIVFDLGARACTWARGGAEVCVEIGGTCELLQAYHAS
jgi:hypothetical protein